MLRTSWFVHKSCIQQGAAQVLSLPKIHELRMVAYHRDLAATGLPQVPMAAYSNDLVSYHRVHTTIRGGRNLDIILNNDIWDCASSHGNTIYDDVDHGMAVHKKAAAAWLPCAAANFRSKTMRSYWWTISYSYHEIVLVVNDTTRGRSLLAWIDTCYPALMYPQINDRFCCLGHLGIYDLDFIEPGRFGQDGLGAASKYDHCLTQVSVDGQVYYCNVSNALDKLDWYPNGGDEALSNPVAEHYVWTQSSYELGRFSSNGGGRCLEALP